MGNAILIRYPSLRSGLQELFDKADAYLTAYNSFMDGGYYIAASKYLSLGFGTIKFLEYLFNLTNSGDGSIEWIINDYLSIETRVYQGLVRTINVGVEPENLFLLAKACELYYRSRKSSTITLLGLTFVINNYAYNNLATKIELIRNLAKALSDLMETEVITVTLAYQTGPRITPDKLKTIGSILRRYASGLSMYAVSYSQATGVYSEIVNYATGYVWSYDRMVKESDDELIILLAGINQLIESMAMAQLYFNLHPGFDEIISRRYDALLKMLPIYVRASGLEDTTAYQYNLERTIIYEDIPSKTSRLERLLAEIKAMLLIKDFYTEEGVMSQVYGVGSEGGGLVESMNTMAPYGDQKILYIIAGVSVLSIILIYKIRYKKF